MVEGPGATRNGRKVQAAVGCTVGAVTLPSSCDVSKSNALQDSLIGCILCEAFSVGKEVFLIFSSSDGNDSATPDVAVRLHFGMNGSLYCAKSISIPQWKQKQEATIRMTLTKPRRTTANHCCENTITNFFDTCTTEPSASAASSDAAKIAGGWFLSCSKGDQKGSNNTGKGCGFFEWAKPEVLAPLGAALTPLL